MVISSTIKNEKSGLIPKSVIPIISKTSTKIIPKNKVGIKKTKNLPHGLDLKLFSELSITLLEEISKPQFAQNFDPEFKLFPH